MLALFRADVRSFVLCLCATFGVACQGTQVTYAPANSASERVAEMLDGYREAQIHKETLVQKEMKAKQADAPSAMELLSQGDKKRDSGSLAAALFDYLQASGTEAIGVAAIERVAHLHLRKDPQRAQVIFEDLLREEPDNASLHVGVGLSFLAQDRPEDAQQALMNAISLDPDSASARCILGVLHDRAGDHGAARESYRVAHHLRPGDYSILNNLATSYILDAMPAEAVPYLDRALVMEPRDPVLHNNMGLALALARDDEAALRAFMEVGSEAEAYNNLGYARYLRGDYREAIEAYERALGVKGDAVLRVIRNMELANEALGEETQVEESDAL